MVCCGVALQSGQNPYGVSRVLFLIEAHSMTHGAAGERRQSDQEALEIEEC